MPRAGGDDEGGAWTPGDAFDDALRVLEVVAGVALIAAAVLLPLALVWLLAWLGHRTVVRRAPRARARHGLTPDVWHPAGDHARER